MPIKTDITSSPSNFRMDVLADYYAAQAPEKTKSSRLFEAFLKMMAVGYWQEGDRIPSETQLTESLPVGLATVQSALRKLTKEGLIFRKRKAGSFVADPTKTSVETFFFKFFHQEGSEPLSLTDTHLSVKKLRKKGYWSKYIPGDKTFIRIDRVINVGGEFQMFSQLFLPGSKFERLLDIPVPELMNLNFHSVIRDQFGVPLTKSDRRISCTQISLELSERLQCNYGLAATQYDIRQFTLHDEPVSFMRTIIPQNQAVLQVAAAK